MTNFDYDIVGNVMDPVIDANTAAAMLEKFKNNFQDSYNSNKAPRGFYLNWRYFTVGYFESMDEVHKNLIVDFYTWLVKTYNDIVFATEPEIIEWIKNPVSLQEIKNNKALIWKCPDITLTLQSVCPNSVKCYPNDNEPFSICGKNNVCPNGNIYPGMVDPSLVSIMTSISTSIQTKTSSTTTTSTSTSPEITSEITTSLPTTTTTPIPTTAKITSTEETRSEIATSLPTTTTTKIIEITSEIPTSLPSPTTTTTSSTSTTETTSEITTSLPTSIPTPTTPTTDTTSLIVANLPTPTPIPIDLNTGGSWVGSVKISTTISEGILCLDNIQVQHDKNTVGKAFILTINFCSSMINAIDHIFGYSSTRIDANGFLQIRMGGSGVFFKKDVSYTVGSMCVVLSDKYRRTFTLSNDVSWGLDIYDNSLPCSLENCPLFCGNGVCDANEAESTCPVDCGKKVICQRNLRRN